MTPDFKYMVWAGIVFCISQSAMFSGLNLAFFSIPRLRLEIEAANRNKAAINFLTLDDIAAEQEGELLHPSSIIKIEHRHGKPVFPKWDQAADNPLLLKINLSGEKWVVFMDQKSNPSIVMDADGFLRAAIFDKHKINPFDFCHEPIIVKDGSIRLGDILPELKFTPQTTEDDVIDQDIILLWGRKKQIITGADILGRLLRGIAKKTEFGIEKGENHV